jgi:ABC-type sugar transport system substrate-binding protein
MKRGDCMKKLFTLLSIVIMAALLMAACPPAAIPVSAAPAGNKLKICFAFQDLETEFWMAGHKSITETLKSKGIQVIEVNSGSDANKQLEQVKDCISQKVDGIMVIPVDGSIALTLIKEANNANIPISIFNRPPQNEDGKAIVVVADNRSVSRQMNEYMAQQARKLGHKVTPLIMVGDLGDPNAVGRKQGFYDVIDANPDLFNKPIEVNTKWDATVAEAGLRDAMTANPDVEYLFTSSDFLFPTIRGIFDPLGKWKKIGEKGHVIIGGLDGDKGACKLIKDSFIEGTGVQDLYFEANSMMTTMLASIALGEKSPDQWIPDPGFALTQGNLATRENDMWGCKLLNGK